MVIPECKNNRHLIVSTTEASSFQEWALILNKEFGPKNYKPPTKVAPNIMIKFAGVFDKSIRLVSFPLRYFQPFKTFSHLKSVCSCFL